MARANDGAGRVSHLALLARSIKELEVPLGCTAVALHIAGRRNAVADALPRFTIRARGLDPYPRRGLRPKFRREVVERCGAIDSDMLARDDGPNARGPSFGRRRIPRPKGRCSRVSFGGIRGSI